LTPSLACSLVTVLSAQFSTQMLAPSKAMPSGSDRTGNVPRLAPSLARFLHCRSCRAPLVGSNYVIHARMITLPAAVVRQPYYSGDSRRNRPTLAHSDGMAFQRYHAAREARGSLLSAAPRR
jgi:hypothetical protein